MLAFFFDYTCKQKGNGGKKMASKYLINARNAREEKNSEDAKRFYDMVRTEDPDNAEAKFFYSYYSLREGTNGEIALRFGRLCNVVIPTIKALAKSEDSKEEKMSVLKAVGDAFIPETWSLNRYMNHLTVGTGSNQERVLSDSDITSVCKNGVNTLYAMGDEIESTFAGDSTAMQVAVAAWKEAITLTQKWYSYFDESLPAKYAEKIKRIDPSYEMPKKGGCIQLADKR